MKRYFLFFLIIPFLSACFYARKTNNYNYTSQKEASPILPKISVYNSSKSKSTLFVKLNASEFLYTQSAKGMSCKIKIACNLFKSFESSVALDSASCYISDIQISNEKVDLISSLEFNCTSQNVYLLEVIVTDLNKKTQAKLYTRVDKMNANSRNNFLVSDIKNGQPLFKNYVAENEKVQLKYNQFSDQKTVHVHYYKREFQLPAPPFSAFIAKGFDYKADSTFTIQLNDSGSTNIALRSYGFYHFQTDTTTKDGFTLFRFNEDFPNITSAEKLSQALRYITTRQEFDEIVIDANKKMQLDNFWLKNSGTRDKAKQNIKTYYGRAQSANDYFTSFTEGWKTDRGLLYIIYGQPNTIYKNSNSETWIYGEENSYKALNFTFVKVLNPFTDNDFSLNRSELYKEDWYRVVDSWREGRVMNDYR